MNHLFGKRYWNRRITTDASLWNVVRYIVQNPRRAGGQGSLEGFRWTSYAATIGLRLADIKLARNEVLQFFSRTRSRAVDDVPNGSAQPLPWRDPSGGSHRDVSHPPESRNCVLGAAAAFRWG